MPLWHHQRCLVKKHSILSIALVEGLADLKWDDQEKIKKLVTSGGEGDDPSDTATGGQERREKLAAETDDLLDEIDDVLEENAEDFVRAYVQKGGQCAGRFLID